jgi:hypothetical protein
MSIDGSLIRKAQMGMDLNANSVMRKTKTSAMSESASDNRPKKQISSKPICKGKDMIAAVVSA